MRALLWTICLLAAALGLQISSSGPLLQSVTRLVSQSPYLPTFLEESPAVDKDVELQTDFCKAVGDSYYKDADADFKRGLDNLGANYTVERCSSVKNGIAVNWKVEFLPYSVETLAFFGRITPGITVVLYDILDREKFVATGFSWEKLQKFLNRILSKGEMLLPKAVIKGQSELVFMEDEEGSYMLTKCVEKLALVRSVDGGFLKNRIIAAHLVEYADAMKPSSIAFDDWDDITTIRLQIQKVPGMRQFDIDGLDPERQQELVKTSNNILGFSFGVVSLFSLVFALQVLDKLNN